MSALDEGKILASDTRYWTETRARLLSQIGQHLDEDLVLNDDALAQLLNNLGAEGNLRRADLHRLQDVLDRLVSKGHIRKAEKVPLYVLPTRTSMLARSAAVHGAVSVITQMNTYLWQVWLAQPLDSDQLLLPFVMSLLADGGFGPPLAPRGFLFLRKSDIQSDHRLSLPVHPRDCSGHRSIIPIPPSAQIILAASLRTRHNEPNGAFVYFPDLVDRIERQRTIAHWLRTEYDRMAMAFTASSGVVAPSWRVFQRAAPQRALHTGATPALLFLQMRVPLPVSVPPDAPATSFTAPLFRSMDSRSPATVRHFDFHIDRNHFNDEAMEDSGPSGPVPSNWSERSCACLNDLTSRLSKLTRRSLTKPAYRDRALKLIENAKTQANLLTSSPRSALHLALDWATHQIQTARSQTASTLTTYFGQVFTTGLLLHTDAVFFDKLSPSRHVDILEAALNRSNIEATHQLNIFTTWKRVYRFATSTLYCAHDMAAKLQDIFYASRRPFLITPQAFDTMFLELWSKGSWEYRTLAVLVALAYYGGLRTGEATELTTRDAIDGGSHLDIYVPGIKSVSARRMVPFGHLAPQFITECVIEYFRTRRLLVTPATGYLYLFGPIDNHGRYNPSDLEDYARRHLRRCFSGLPVFHSLRHGFASFLFVRFHALRHPDFLLSLPERGHEMFSTTGLSRFCFLLTGCYDKPLGDDYAHGLRELCRLMGHADPSTFVESYVHTFDRIQADLQRTLAETLGNEVQISRATIARLIPNMRSSKSRAKLARLLTASQLLPHAWGNL